MFPFQPHEYTTCAVICKPLIAKGRDLNDTFYLDVNTGKVYTDILNRLYFGKKF